MKIKYDIVGNTPKVIFTDNKVNSSITLSGDNSNCKLSYIHEVGNLKYLSDDNKKKVLDFALEYCKGTIFINTTNKEVAEFIRDNYTCYYYYEVPIGYNDGFQYHLNIKNTIKINPNCKEPTHNENGTVIIKEKIIEKPVEKVVEVIKEVPKVIGGYSRKRIERVMKKFTKEENLPEEFIEKFVEKVVNDIPKKKK